MKTYGPAAAPPLRRRACSSAVAGAQGCRPGPRSTITRRRSRARTCRSTRASISRCCATACRKASDGRIEVEAGELAREQPQRARDHPPRALRPGRYRCRAARRRCRATCRSSTASTSPGLNPTIEQARKVAERACCPIANKELERFNTRIVATYPFPAQVLFCRQPITDLADLKGRKVRTHGGSLNDLVQSIGAQPVAHRLPRGLHARSSAASSIAPSPARARATARAGTRSTKHIYTLPLAWAIAGYYGQRRAGGTSSTRRCATFIEKTFARSRTRNGSSAREATRGRHRLQHRQQADGCKIGTLVERQADDRGQADRGRQRGLLRKSSSRRRAARPGSSAAARVAASIYNEVVAPITGKVRSITAADTARTGGATPMRRCAYRIRAPAAQRRRRAATG